MLARRHYGLAERSRHIHDASLTREHSHAGHRVEARDHVFWNAEAGRVRGTTTRVVTLALSFKGYTVHASKDEPQYEIKGDTTDRSAMHTGSALRKLRT
jgi:hypothetical protein